MDEICLGADMFNPAWSNNKIFLQSLKSCNFELKKWSSNISRANERYIIKKNRTSGSISFEGEKLAVLDFDIKWRPYGDFLGFDFSSIQFAFTKRGVLSFLVRIFDPFGLLSPVIFFSKI